MSEWIQMPRSMNLAPDEVHVCRVAFNGLDPEQEDAYMASLSLAERKRAARCVMPEHRRRFMVGRGAVRHLLAGHCGVEPSELKLTYGVRGKPFLGPPYGETLHFNVTHSADTMLVAMARSGPVGVDFQDFRLTLRFAPVMSRILAPSEKEAWDRIPQGEQWAALLRMWTAKEAYSKAHGKGLSLHFTRIEVASVLTEQGAMWHPISLVGTPPWKLHLLWSERLEAAAIVVTQGVQRVRCWEVSSR